MMAGQGRSPGPAVFARQPFADEGRLRMAPAVARIHDWIRARKGLCFLLAATVWIVAALVATRMRTDTSSLAFFPDSAPELRQMAEALDVSPASRLLFVDLSTSDADGRFALAQTADAVVQALDPDLVERAGVFVMPEPEKLLALLPFMTDEAALEVFLAARGDEQVDAAIRSARDGLGGLPASAALPWLQADPLAFRRVLLSRLPALEAELLPDPMLGYPVSPDGRHLLLLLRPRHSIHDVRTATRLVDSLQEAIQTHMRPDMRSIVVGGHLHSAANTRTIERDATKIILFSVAGFVLIYFLLVRSRGALWLLLVPLFSICVALGGMTLLVPVLSGLALGFGASMLGLAEDYAVHMHFALRSGRDPSEVVAAMVVPLFQGYLINAAGFAVLLLSGVPAVRQSAGFALLTISAGFVLAVTIVPVCPWFAQPVAPAASRTPGRPRRPVAWRVIACALALVSLSCAFFAAVRIDASPRVMGADAAIMQEDAERLRSVWGARDREMIVIRGRDRDEAMDRARSVVAFLRQQRPEDAVDALCDIWPAPEQRRENLERWNSFVREHGEGLSARIREAARKHGFTEDAFASFERLLRPTQTAFGPELLRAAGLGELLDTFLHEAAHDPGKVTALAYTQKRAD
ncbi:MAG: hypothetical protein LBH94_04865, partial [Deltaproteobacteria bacterium]|nr:hypothetical protein [Deltaproteobacteria bacterium]